MMDNIKINKKISGILRQSEKNAKRETCILCGKQVTSFCNSHVVPQFVLKSIASNGIVSLPATFVHSGSYSLKASKGIKNAETFHLICNNCDNTVFQEYENETSMKEEPSNKLMAEIAIKDVLLLLSKRFTEVELYKILDTYNFIEGKEVIDETKNLDLRDYQFSLRRSKKIIEKNLKSGYRLIYWKSFPYIAPIAAQIPISVYKGLSGEVVNDRFNYSTDIRMQDLHICIFPLKNSTSVFMFYHRDDRNYVKFERDFQKLSEEDKQKYIVYLLFKYTEDFLISPSITDIINSSSELIELINEGTLLSNLDFIYSFEHLNNLEENLVDWKSIPNLLSYKYSIKNSAGD